MQIFNQNIKSEEGNVLFLILIAVALFAALSYAVTQSTRSGGGGAGKETNLIKGSQITQYPSTVRNAMVRMQVSGGTDSSEFAFNPPSDFDTSETDSDASNLVFHPEGGGATFQGKAKLGENTQIGPWKFVKGKVDNISTSDEDFLAILPDIPLGVCNGINARLGLPDGDSGNVTIASDISGDITDSIEEEAGTVTSHSLSSSIGDGTNDTALSGEAFGCFDNAGSDFDSSPYAYYHVILEQ